MEKVNSKRNVGVVLLLIIALLSVFVFSNVASSTKTHAKTIKALDDKKMLVMEITAATAGIATTLALVPGDATTPIANQFANLSTYLLIVIGAVFLEKILVTLTGYVTFTFLIPIACLLYAIYLFVPKEMLKNLAIKLSLFGIVIFIVVPISVKVSDLIENTYQTTIDQTIEEAKGIENVTEGIETEEIEQDESWWETITSKVEEGISSIGNTISGWAEKGKNMLSKFIDAIAVLLITSCIIPIVVLIFFMWIAKIIFGINIPTINTKNIKFYDNEKQKLKSAPDDSDTE